LFAATKAGSRPCFAKKRLHSSVVGVRKTLVVTKLPELECVKLGLPLFGPISELIPKPVVLEEEEDTGAEDSEALAASISIGDGGSRGKLPFRSSLIIKGDTSGATAEASRKLDHWVEEGKWGEKPGCKDVVEKGWRLLCSVGVRSTAIALPLVVPAPPRYIEVLGKPRKTKGEVG